ncbi:MAG: amidohydrolase, partial [Spirochaetales bacterium]|nr:amidohydrolase [Spirochaetales bacterium]
VSKSSKKHNLPALYFTYPEMPAEELEKNIISGGFLGIKVYLSLAPNYLPNDEVRIYDFLPPHQLELMNKHGWIVMLHIPRSTRLKDPVNLAQMMEIDEKYPNLKLIIAHVGRAYCTEDVGDAFEILSKSKNLYVDFSANTNSSVFEQLIKAIGPKRILFGSDMPILRMRMKRICENGKYLNVVPRGLYGDVSYDPNMREVDSPEADELTFFMYEELRAFKKAAKKSGLGKKDIEDIFYNNSKIILDSIV